MRKIPVLCVVGPTASGKTALAIQLAHAVDGEIINMDSMQIYRRMDIGTAKPSAKEREGITHHLLDIVEPTEAFSVAQYAEQAESCIREIAGRGKLPMLVGGTGFYLRAITDGLNLGGIPSDMALRESLKASAADEKGKLALHRRLAEVDAASARKLHPNDITRVSRALEVYLLTGKPLSAQTTVSAERPYTFCMLGTTLERATLYHRTDERVDDMLARGLLREVETLLRGGVTPGAQAMQGIGYKELTPVLLQGTPIEEAAALMKRNTRRYAKRQWTWFNAESRVQWLDMTEKDSIEKALRIGEAFRREHDR
ncbi:MAG: tRNA (adenosine(37)-N6)-dimethylallyltransferase MiaA [Eubacteriales bacterium]|nr:tRNA (adenosine(37)-N6)-dimethylallyltransferase MiaA [Eubacteriales bacterium]